MGVFQASVLKAMKYLRDEFQSFKKTSKEVGVNQTSTSASKPVTSKQTENLDPTPLRLPPRTQLSSHTDEAIGVDLYGPLLPPHLGDDHSIHDSDLRHVLDQHSGQSEEPSRVVSARPKKHADKRKHKVRSRYLSHSSSSD